MLMILRVGQAVVLLVAMFLAAYSVHGADCPDVEYASIICPVQSSPTCTGPQLGCVDRTGTDYETDQYETTPQITVPRSGFTPGDLEQRLCYTLYGCKWNTTQQKCLIDFTNFKQAFNWPVRRTAAC